MWKLIVDELNSFITKLHIDIFVLKDFGFTHVAQSLSVHNQAKVSMGSVLSGLFPKLFARCLGMSYVHCILVLKIRYTCQNVKVFCAPNNRDFPEIVEVT